MPFALPPWEILKGYANQLKTLYQKERAVMDGARFFGSFRGKTTNPERLHDIDFIRSLANHMALKGTFYVTGKQKSTHGLMYSSSDETINSLTTALSGAFLIQVIKISDDYVSKSSVRFRSALAKLVLNFFNVETVSEIPRSEIHRCLSSLKNYLEATTRTPIEVKWHKTKSNAELFQDIKEMKENYADAKSSKAIFSVFG